jgi:hypothetical protein
MKPLIPQFPFALFVVELPEGICTVDAELTEDFM